MATASPQDAFAFWLGSQAQYFPNPDTTVFSKPASPTGADTLPVQAGISPTVPTQGPRVHPKEGIRLADTEYLWPACRLFISLFLECAGRTTAGLLSFMNHLSAPIEVGKYRVSPLAKELEDGGYSASVSIRSGKGSATHDRVMRFSNLFDNAATAVSYATEQALGWIRERAPAPCM
jgi:hypothetical protein